MKKQLYYIGERSNPQLTKSYYVGYGQLSKVKAESCEECSYGSMTLTGYKTKKEYEDKIKELKSENFTVNIR